MTIRAREVLEDCRQALDEIQDGVVGRQWRIRWIAAIALLRSVGHVLKNVDSASNPLMKRHIDEAWVNLVASKPKPTIFWEFIQKERNNILKEYRIRAGQGVTIRPGPVHVNLKTGEQHAEPGQPTLYHLCH